MGKTLGCTMVEDPCPIIKCSTSTTTQQTTWRNDTTSLDPVWKKSVQHSYELLIDTLSVHPECLKVSHGPTKIAPIDLMMMMLLVIEFDETLSPPQLADTLHALQMAERKETKDLMWQGKHMGFYLVFLDRPKCLGEAAVNPGGRKDSEVVMDVDPLLSNSKQVVHTKSPDITWNPTIHSLFVTNYTPTSESSPVSSVPPPQQNTSTLQCTSASRPSIKTQQQQQQQQVSPHSMSAVPVTPMSVSTLPWSYMRATSETIQSQSENELFFWRGMICHHGHHHAAPI